jgi:RNA recognition motif-containing protein
MMENTSTVHSESNDTDSRNSDGEQRLQKVELPSSSDVATVSKLVQSGTPTLTTTPYSSTTVYMSGMPIRYCTESVIEKIMSPYGKIIRCTVHTQPSNKLFAFCDFAEPKQAIDAIRAVHGRLLGGQPLVVRPAFKENTTKTAVNHAPAVKSSTIQDSNPKRQRQQLDSKIDAIKRKLAKQTHGGDT